MTCAYVTSEILDDEEPEYAAIVAEALCILQGVLSLEVRHLRNDSRDLVAEYLHCYMPSHPGRGI